MEYVNVKLSGGMMERMLEFSGGGRNVPVIVEGGKEGGKTTVGFGGT